MKPSNAPDLLHRICLIGLVGSVALSIILPYGSPLKLLTYSAVVLFVVGFLIVAIRGRNNKTASAANEGATLAEPSGFGNGDGID